MQREPSAELAASGRLTWPGFALDLGAGELLDANGRPTELRAQALKVLLILGERAGQVVGKDELMRRVWGDVVVTEDSLVQAVGDIRRVLGDAKHERLRTVPRRGYMFVADEPATHAAAPPVPAAASTQVLPRSPHFRFASGLGVACLLLAVFLAGWMAAHTGGSVPALPRSLAILPFESDGGTEDWFATGVASDLTALMGGWTETTVIGRGSTAVYKGRDVDPRVVGRELGVAHVVTGRARRDADQVRLAVSLVETETGRTVWSELRDVPRADIGALIGDVAGGIARTMTVEWGDAVAATSARRGLQPQQVQADDLAMQGMAELLRGVTRENWERSRRLFEQAVALDPASRRGLAGVTLSNVNLVLWLWSDDPARDVARAGQALAQLDLIAPDLLMTRLAHASMAYTRHDWAGLAVVTERLVRDYPNEPSAHHHRCGGLLRLARFEEAIVGCQRAIRISPRDSRVPTWQGLMGFNQFQLGRYAEAEQTLRASTTGNPRVPFYFVLLAAALAEQERRDEAARVMREAMTRHPDFRRSTISGYWVGTDPRFLAGRDRIIARAGELGLPP
jgi:TolB-like protein/DNA-binding winged helix-turn-helix (wHTH) protein/tetratricopeptide (TPR) repeat protein